MADDSIDMGKFGPLYVSGSLGLRHRELTNVLPQQGARSQTKCVAKDMRSLRPVEARDTKAMIASAERSLAQCSLVQ